jgi:hypothetical protein
MSKKKENRRKQNPSTDSKVNLITAIINLIIALMNIIAIMKIQK